MYTSKRIHIVMRRKEDVNYSVDRAYLVKFKSILYLSPIQSCELFAYQLATAATDRAFFVGIPPLIFGSFLAGNTATPNPLVSAQAALLFQTLI